MMKHVLLSIFIGLFSFGLGAQTEWAELPHTKVRAHLFSDQSAEHRDLVFEFQFDDHWHTYWTNPGDSGAPPRFQFKNLKAPEKIKGPLYRVPERIVLGPITTYGFSGTLLVPFQIPTKDLPESLSVDLEFLVCEDICIPANHLFEISTFENLSGETELLEEALRSIPKTSPHFRFSFDQLETKKLKVKSLTNESYLLEDVFLKSESRRIHTKPVILQSSAKNFEVIYPKPVMKDYEGVALFKNSNGESLAVKFLAVKDQSEIWMMIVFAFLGGLILNLMPCVLPVLSLKVLSLSKSDKNERRQSILGYSLGVFLCFEIFALTLLAFRSSGEALGWGFQLQSPWFLVFMCFLFAAMAANLFGIWEFDWTSSQSSQNRANSPFLREIPTGFLSVLVASPCTAPFMGASLGYALTQSPVNVLIIFASLALGLCFPFLPGLILKNYRIPLRSGPWMQNFKVFLGFPLIATSLWLAFVYSQLTSNQSAFWLLGLVILLFMGLWILQSLLAERSKLRLFSVLILCFLLFFIEPYFRLEETNSKALDKATQANSSIAWVPFSEETLNDFREQKKTVFVDFTADWCLSCKVNEKVTFEDSEVQDFIKKNEVVMMKADWTKKNPEITKILKNYGRIGVPLYLLFKSGQNQVQILPEVLTPKIFKNAFEKK